MSAPVTPAMLTDEELRRLKLWADDLSRACTEALQPEPDSPFGKRVEARRSIARQRICDAINARAKERIGDAP